MHFEKFKKDLSLGDLYQEDIVRWLLNRNILTISRNDTSAFDIACRRFGGGDIFTIEIKSDTWETYNHKTNNLLIEFRHNGKNSGIRASKADLWCYYFPDMKEAWWIKTRHLKEAIRQFNPHTKYGVGDDCKADAFVFDRTEHKHLFTVTRI